MKLLLAEDERSLARALVKIMEKNHHSADAVHNGEDALAFLENTKYDAAILDVMMPKMDGLSVLKAIRAKGIHTPVILLTARAEIEDRVKGLDSGANYYLTKPFDSRELLAAIRAVTRSSSTVDSKLSVGNVTLDLSTYTLSSPHGAFRLANKEFQMMELLMTNPHVLISAERFLERIWGYDSDAEINVVWVYVSYLRKKLAALEADIEIKASRNAGYSLESKVS
jgi:DNA-binding response OmpR family regulator